MNAAGPVGSQHGKNKPRTSFSQNTGKSVLLDCRSECKRQNNKAIKGNTKCLCNFWL